jgi:hypothetical protein
MIQRPRGTERSQPPPWLRDACPVRIVGPTGASYPHASPVQIVGALVCTRRRPGPLAPPSRFPSRRRQIPTRFAGLVRAHRRPCFRRPPPRAGQDGHPRRTRWSGRALRWSRDGPRGVPLGPCCSPATPTPCCSSSGPTNPCCFSATAPTPSTSTAPPTRRCYHG